jgi:hypothetical protein
MHNIIHVNCTCVYPKWHNIANIVIGQTKSEMIFGETMNNIALIQVVSLGLPFRMK